MLGKHQNRCRDCKEPAPTTATDVTSTSTLRPQQDMLAKALLYSRASWCWLSTTYTLGPGTQEAHSSTVHRCHIGPSLEKPTFCPGKNILSQSDRKLNRASRIGIIASLRLSWHLHSVLAGVGASQSNLSRWHYHASYLNAGEVSLTSASAADHSTAALPSDPPSCSCTYKLAAAAMHMPLAGGYNKKRPELWLDLQAAGLRRSFAKCCLSARCLQSRHMGGCCTYAMRSRKPAKIGSTKSK